jgi:hypothetical protein
MAGFPHAPVVEGPNYRTDRSVRTLQSEHDHRRGIDDD